MDSRWPLQSPPPSGPCRGRAYRALRKKGVTVRKPVDCMIASVAIEHGLSLLHNDRDFDHIAKYSKLKILTTEKPTR
ncbi:PIN domain-containing protein [Verrucomicrobiota bacterium]